MPAKHQRRLDVSHTVTKVERAGKIYCRIVLCGTPKQQQSRFAALTHFFRSMWAVVRHIDSRSPFSQQLIELPRHPRQIVNRKKATADSGLIRNYDDRHKCCIYPGNCISGSWNQPYVCWIRQVMRIFDDHAVAIEENRGWKHVHASAAMIAVTS